MKDMYSKPTNRTELSIPLNKKPCVATLSLYIYIQTKERSGKGNNQNVPEQLDQESSITFEIYSDYACPKVSRETLRTIDSLLEQSSQSVWYNNYLLLGVGRLHDLHQCARSRGRLLWSDSLLVLTGYTICISVPSNRGGCCGQTASGQTARDNPLLGVRRLHDQGCSGDGWSGLLQPLLSGVKFGHLGKADRPHIFSCSFVKGASL